MAMKCQLVRPGCWNFAVDMHCAAIQWPFIPLPKGWYFNAASTEWAVGDKQHAKIRESGDGLIKLGHDCQFLRPHFPFPVPFPEVIFWAVFTALGSSKTVWASFRTKHGGEPTAVMFLGFGSCVAVINQADCGDLWFNPTILSVQRPTNVFAGMSLGDFLGCLFLIIVDAILSKLLEKLFDKVLGKLKGKLSKWLKSTKLGKYFDDLGKKFAKLSAKLNTKIASTLMKAPGLRSLVSKSVGQNQFRYATKILLQFKNNPLRHELAQNAVDRAQGMLEKKFGEMLGKQLVKPVAEKVVGAGAQSLLGLPVNPVKAVTNPLATASGAVTKAVGLPVDPVKAVTKPHDVITDLLKGGNNANADRLGALIDGRPYTPPAPTPPRP